MGNTLFRLLTAFVLALGATPVVMQAQEDTLHISVTRNGAPAQGVQIVMEFVNAPKPPPATTGIMGDLALVLNLGKNPRMQVVIYDCPNDEHIVVFVEVGAEMPENEKCRRRVAGIVIFGKGRRVLVDVATGVVQSEGGQSFFGTTTGKLVAGGGAALVAVAVVAAGGGDPASSTNTPANTPSTSPTPPTSTPFNPTGSYPVTNTPANDPGGHVTFIAMEGNTVLTVTVTGSTVVIVCPQGSKWTRLEGSFNTATGEIVAQGTGTAAGRPNVLFRFTGTITLSGSNQGRLNGTLTIGAGGELPGGQATTYTVTGTKS
jgi:hypothetical protein